MRIRWIILLMTLLLLAAVQPLVAQDNASDCSPMIETRLANLQAQCSLLDPNSACLGTDIAGLTLHSGDGPGESGSRITLADLQTVQTSALDPEAEQWGVAVLNSQATVPMSHEGPGLTFVMLGDVMLENLVPAESAVSIVEPIPVTALVQSNIRDVPSTNSNVIASAAPGTPLEADALSADQEWIRVMYEGRIAWLSRSLVSSEQPLGDLPVMQRGQMGLMQEFVLQTGSGLADCAGAVPSILIVQGPSGIPVDIVVNGAQIRISSTIALWITELRELRVLVLNGSAQIGNLNLPAGFTSKALLSEDGRSLAGAWENVRPMTEGERQALLALQDIPGDVLSYVIEIPTDEDVSSTLAALAQSAASGGARSGNVSGADCGRFRPTSPLDGLAFGNTTFYWDAALGANDYRLNIYNDAGTLVSSTSTGSDNTALTVDTGSGSIGDGITFSWEVEALVNNGVACITARVPLPRASAPQLAGGGGGNDDADNPGSGGGQWGN